MTRSHLALALGLAFTAPAFAQRVEQRVESLHPYLSEQTTQETVAHPGASSLVLHFERIELAPGDVLTVLDAAQREVARWTDSGDLRGVDVAVDGDQATLRFETNERITRYGFALAGYTPAVSAGLDEPQAIHTERLEIESFGLDRVNDSQEFAGDRLWVVESYPIGSAGLRSTRLAEYTFRPDGVTRRTLGHARTNGLARVGETLVGGSYGSHLVEAGASAGREGRTLAYVPHGLWKTTQLAANDAGVLFAWNHSRLMLFDTASPFGWLPTIDLADAPRAGAAASAGAIDANDRWVAVNLHGSNQRRIAVFDVRDPYAPEERPGIHLATESVNDKAQPVLDEDHILLPFGAELRCFEARTGYEIGYLELPEPIRFGSASLDGDTLYACGTWRVYAIDVSDPYRPTLRGEIALRRLPHANGVQMARPVDGHLYVIWGTPTTATQSAGRALTVYRLPLGW